MNNMPLEASTRVLIDRALENLGWNFKGKNQNVYLEQPKTQKERKLLKGNRPDYVLYSKESDNPLIVIEAKKPGEKLDRALSQGIDYARTLGAPLVFATDGVFCKSYHTGANRTPILNGEEVDEFIREALALRYLTGYEVNTISPKVQYDRKELIKVFDEANNMLRGVGLRAGIERFGEFANILFLKLIGESEQAKRERGEPSSFDIACSWESIKNIPTTARIDYINNTVFKRLNSLYETEIFTNLTMQDPSILKEIMDKLDPLMLTDVDSDIKGDAFEYFLKASASTKNDLGEYFTPRHIVKTMVRLINPQIGEKIYDPFCGTGGFLIESFRYIERNMVRDNPTLTKMLREETIYGNEITNTARITKMNMILAGDGHSNIHMQDSLANPVYVNKLVQNEKGELCRKSDGSLELSDENYGGYDIVLANMPYSQKTKYGNLYDLPSTNGDSICVQHCIKAVNAAAPNGRMALVVPEGFLFRKDLSKAREYLLENCQLQSIISLPQGVFLPYTGVKTNIIFATKVNRKIKSSERKKDFWYFDVKSDGYSLDNHRRKLDRPSDLANYEEYRKLDSEQTEDMLKVGFEVIPLDKVRANSNILVGSRYRETTSSSVYETLKFEEFATLTRGVTYSKASQSTVKTNTVILPADNITLSGELVIKRPIYLNNDVSISADKQLKQDDIFICMSSGSKDHIGKVAYIHEDTNYYAGGFMGIIRTNPYKCLSKYLYFYLLSSEKFREEIKLLTQGANINNISSTINAIEIPLPNIEKQIEIVEELNSYQKTLHSANMIVDSYKPIMPIDPNWELIKLGDLCELQSGGTPSRSQQSYWNKQDIPWYSSGELNDFYTKDPCEYISNEGLANSNAKVFSKNSLLIGMYDTAAFKMSILDRDAAFNQAICGVKPNDKINMMFLLLYFSANKQKYLQLRAGVRQRNLTKQLISEIKIPNIDLSAQEQLIINIEEEIGIINQNKRLIELYEKKIKDRAKEIWGDTE